jgi:ABC-type uncharacterized transport system auxiliary subunit
MKNTLLAACGGILLLSGCGSVLKSDEPAATIFSLRAENAAPARTPNGTSKVLEIQRPLLPPGFDTNRIAMYLNNGRELNYYSGAQWPAPLDETLQDFTEQLARQALPGAILASPGQAIDLDHRLQIKVNDFQPVYAGAADRAPTLKASMSFTLLSMPDEEILTHFTVQQEMPAEANNLGAVAAGLQALLQSVETQAFATIDRHLRKPGRAERNRVRSSPEVPL